MADSDNEHLYNELVPKTYYVIRDMTCSNCHKHFNMPSPRYQRMKLEKSHENLRAEYANTEPVYYEVIFCPHCGYTRLRNNFETLSDLKRKLYKDEIGNKFKKRVEEIAIDAEIALERYKFGLVTAKAMSLPASEIAVLFYKQSWVKQIKGDEAGYIQSVMKSYEWFEKALAEEHFPVQSIDQDTAAYLMSVFAKDYGDYAASLKHLGTILTSATASDRLKGRARDLKDDVVKLKEKYPNGVNRLEEVLAQPPKTQQDLADIKERRVQNFRADEAPVADKDKDKDKKKVN